MEGQRDLVWEGRPWSEGWVLGGSPENATAPVSLTVPIQGREGLYFLPNLLPREARAHRQPLLDCVLLGTEESSAGLRGFSVPGSGEMCLAVPGNL